MSTPLNFPGQRISEVSPSTFKDQSTKKWSLFSKLFSLILRCLRHMWPSSSSVGRVTPVPPSPSEMAPSFRSQHSGRTVYDHGSLPGSKPSIRFAYDSTSTLGHQRTRSSSSHHQFRSTGRGGAGNFYAPPTLGERAPEEPEGPSVVRGTIRSSSSPKKIVSGRGGAGNVHTLDVANTRPNKSSPLSEVTQAESEYLFVHRASRCASPQSSGRGGAGNITTPSSQPGAILISKSVMTL
ncbi:hypothetical protein BC826DRAFT_979233 [Russula brevipes]|nr:hypothetical protein BC826DRAFT_979233 [Russula brevipes]